MKHLKDSIRERHAHATLSASEVAQLLSMQKKKQRSKAYFAMAASILVFAVGFWFVAQQPSSQAIAQEVVVNHTNAKTLEIESGQLTQLKKHFHQLSFVLKPFNQVDLSKWEVLGGRYCSLQGNKAAQIRLKHKESGRIETLYQAPYQNSNLQKLALENQPITKISNNIQVSMWVNEGVLFSMTQSYMPDIR